MSLVLSRWTVDCTVNRSRRADTIHYIVASEYTNKADRATNDLNINWQPCEGSSLTSSSSVAVRRATAVAPRATAFANRTDSFFVATDCLSKLLIRTIFYSMLFPWEGGGEECSLRLCSPLCCISLSGSPLELVHEQAIEQSEWQTETRRPETDFFLLIFCS